MVSATVTMATADWSLLAPSGYPSVRVIFSSVALTFFAVPFPVVVGLALVLVMLFRPAGLLPSAVRKRELTERAARRRSARRGLCRER